MPAPRPQTIYSLSSGHGRAGVAVLRVSGPQADAAVLALAGRLPPPRLAALTTLRSPSGGILDRGLILRFEAGASFTGESIAEFHVHGGRAVVRAMLDALAALPELRLAEPGEFTRRAVENGKLDLAQAEALGDLIDAETERQRQQALHGCGGALGAGVARWRELLMEAKALVAAEIDFSDEGDVGEGAAAGVNQVLSSLAQELAAALQSADRGRIVAEGFRIAIVGPPNAGKSTLLNRLAGSDIAIVTEHPGTTRDVLEVRLEIEGYEVVLMDTAGLRETEDPVERIGIERARRAASEADLILLLDDGTRGDWIERDPPWRSSIRVRTKLDLAAADEPTDGIAISALTGEGIDSLMECFRLALDAEMPRLAEPAILTRRRHVEAVEAALDQVKLAAASSNDGIEFVAQHLQDADRALGAITGLIDVEEVLGAIFSRFCVGK